MSNEDDLRKLRQKLGVARSDATLLGHPAPGEEDVEGDGSDEREEDGAPQGERIAPPPSPGKLATPPPAEPPPREQRSTPPAEPPPPRKQRSTPPAEQPPPRKQRSTPPAAKPPPLPPGGAPQPEPAFPPAEDTVELEEVEMTELFDETVPTRVSPPAPGLLEQSTTPPSVDLQPESEAAEELPPQPEPLLAEQTFYEREAEALTAHQPERAAMMWLQAATAAEARDAASAAERALERAFELAPESPQVVPLLRRTHLRRKQFDRVVELTDKQVELGGSNVTRVGALVETAALVRFVQGERQRALDLLQRALDLQAGHVVALATASALHLELGQDQATVDTLERLTETLSSPEERALCLYSAGSLLEARLEQPERAETCYARAADADPENLPALLALCSLHAHLGQWEQLARRLEQLARLDVDAASRARFLLQAGSLHLDRTHDLGAAARVLAGAAAAAPQNPAPLVRLTYVFEAKGRTDELVATLRQLLPLTLDPHGQGSLLTRIGWLQQSRIGNIDEAVQAYLLALKAVPGYLPALQALGTLHRQRGDFEQLLALLQPETEGTEPPGRRAMRCVEMAEILAQELHHPERAVRAYRRALEIVPGLPLAFWGLRQLLRDQGRLDELAGLLEGQVEHTADAKSRQHLLLELARLQASSLDLVDPAIATLRRARELAESRSAAIELLELLERAERYSELVELLLAEADDTDDAAEARGRRLQAAAVLEHLLDEPERALEICNEVLGQHPTSAAAIRTAGRIYHRLGRWKDLVELHRHELQTDKARADAAQILCRIGRVHEEAMGDPAGAIAAYMEALDRDPASVVALDALERLARTEERHEELVGVLERHAETRKEPVAAADVLCRAAELADSKLGDLGRAAKLYDQAIERARDLPTALHGLLDVQLRQGRHEPACQTLQQLIDTTGDPSAKAHLQLDLLRVAEYHLDRPPAAAEYDALVQTSPYGNRLRAEQLRVRRLTDDPDLAGALFHIGAVTSDPPLAAAYLLESAHRFEFSDSRAEQLQAAEQAFARQPDDPAVLWCFQRALHATSSWATLASLFETEAATEVDPALRLPLLGEAAHFLMLAAQQQEAARLVRQCLAIDRHHLPSLRLLARLAAEQQSWAELASWQDQIALSCADPANRLESCIAASDLWATQVGDPRRALVSLQLTLKDEPGQPAAFARAERLLLTLEDFAQLSQLYTRRIRECSDEAQRIELLRFHARLLRDKLGDTTRAIAELSELLALAPDDIAALGERADLLCRQQRWSDAVTTLSTLIEKTDDWSVKRKARLDQARIWLNELHEAKRARAVLEQALADDAADVDAKRLLVQVAFVNGEWQETRKLLEEIAADERPELQVWAMSQLAEVARIGLRDDTLRVECERAALTEAASHADLLRELFDRYRQRSDHERLAELALSVVQETTRADVAAPLRLEAARVLLEEAKQPARALEILREALHVQPDDVPAKLLFARALEQQGEHEAAAGSYRQLLQADIGCADAYRGLARLMSVLGQPAISAAAAAALDLLGAASPVEAAQVEAMERAGPPLGRFDPAALPLEGPLRPLRQLLELVQPHLGGMYQLPLSSPLASSHPVTAVTEQLAAALGVNGVKVSVEGAEPATVGAGQPTPLQIAPRLARAPQSPAFRFWVGRALSIAASAGSLVERLPDAELDALLEALTTPRPLDPSVQQLRKQALRALPRRVRKQLEQMELPQRTTGFWPRLRQITRERADQLGLVLSCNPRVVLDELIAHGGASQGLNEPRLQQLVQFSISDEFSRYYHALWSAPA